MEEMGRLDISIHLNKIIVWTYRFKRCFVNLHALEKRIRLCLSLWIWSFRTLWRTGIFTLRRPCQYLYTSYVTPVLVSSYLLVFLSSCPLVLPSPWPLSAADVYTAVVANQVLSSSSFTSRLRINLESKEFSVLPVHRSPHVDGDRVHDQCVSQRCVAFKSYSVCLHPIRRSFQFLLCYTLFVLFCAYNRLLSWLIYLLVFIYICYSTLNAFWIVLQVCWRRPWRINIE